MLTEVCDFVHNYFERAYNSGTFTIENGSIAIPGIIEGQRFRVLGSALNDGIYTYHASGIKDDDDSEAANMQSETFTGTVVTMGVPAAFLKIVADIVAWQEKNAAVVESPYASESFGGYSYTKATGGGADENGGGTYTWRDMFRSRLNAYRKIA